MNPTNRTAQLFARYEDGEKGVLDELIPLIYQDLRAMARHHLKAHRLRQTMGTTALVNEAYLRLSDQRELRPESRAHFFGIAGLTMRRVLVDYARARTRQKRGGRSQSVPIEDVEHALVTEADAMLSIEEAEQITALDSALTKLSEASPRTAEIVQYRYFAGLTLKQTAEVMDVSTKTVQREWTSARAWLLHSIKARLDLDLSDSL